DLGHEIWIGDAAQIRSRRRPESGYSFRKSPIPLRTVQTPVETEATAPHVCVSGETGNLSAPTASATLAIENAEPWAIWPSPLNYRSDFLCVSAVLRLSIFLYIF